MFITCVEPLPDLQRTLSLPCLHTFVSFQFSRSSCPSCGRDAVCMKKNVLLYQWKLVHCFTFCMFHNGSIFKCLNMYAELW